MLAKLVSGRFILTIAAAFVFVWAALSKILSPAEIVAVVMFVFQAYFNRNDRNTKGGDNV
jgi:hypothetical protein